MNFDFGGLEDFVNEKMGELSVPGMSIAVVRGEEVVYSRCFGYKDVENKLPPDENTVYAIASLTKAMTATCAGILVDEGKLAWDEPVITYLPEFRMLDKFAERNVTLRDMLSHNTGLPRHDMSWYGDGALTTKEIVERIGHLKPNKSFRSLYEYNNFMFAAVGYIIERVTGTTWNEFIKARLFDPLGMVNTTTVVDGLRKAENRALPYKGSGEFRDGKIHIHTDIMQDPGCNFDGMGACGSVNSTIADMAAWASMNLMKGSYKGKRILSEQALKEIHTPHTVKRGETLIPEIPILNYGLGWNTRVYRGRFNLAHGGNIDGYASHISLLPEENVGIVILTNRRSTVAHYAVANTFIDHMLGYGIDAKDWAAYYRAEEDREIAGLIKSNEAVVAARNGDKPHSKALKDYTGRYENKGYGGIDIAVKDGRLWLTFNGFERELAHNNYDIFDFNLSDDFIEHRTLVRFVLGRKGDVTELHAEFEKGLKGEFIIFGRLE